MGDQSISTRELTVTQNLVRPTCLIITRQHQRQESSAQTASLDQRLPLADKARPAFQLGTLPPGTEFTVRAKPNGNPDDRGSTLLRYLDTRTGTLVYTCTMHYSRLFVKMKSGFAACMDAACQFYDCTSRLRICHFEETALNLDDVQFVAFVTSYLSHG